MADAIAEGQRIQHNFVKPHMALKGETPAKKVGIAYLKGENKWAELLRYGLGEIG